jgi:hypothetical protein
VALLFEDTEVREDAEFGGDVELKASTSTVSNLPSRSALAVIPRVSKKR